jgi:2-iminoacetate synthase
MESFIDEKGIEGLLKESEEQSEDMIKSILKKAMLLKGLDLKDVASLINIKNRELMDLLFRTALKIKQSIYGNRLVLFAPLYVSNYCSNNCLYCGFRRDNKGMKRKCLDMEEIKDETRLILEQGHKRILMLMGEHPTECAFDYFLKAIDAAYSVRDSRGSSIRRINVEIAPLKEDEFQRLSKVKMTRVLASLERKNLIVKERHGLTNRIRLK